MQRVRGGTLGARGCLALAIRRGPKGTGRVRGTEGGGQNR